MLKGTDTGGVMGFLASKIDEKSFLAFHGQLLRIIREKKGQSSFAFAFSSEFRETTPHFPLRSQLAHIFRLILSVSNINAVTQPKQASASQPHTKLLCKQMRTAII